MEENFALQLETICFGEEERRQIGKVSLNAKHRIKRIVTDNARITKKNWLIGERRKYMQIVGKNVHWKVIKIAFRIHCHPKRRRFKPLSSSLELTTVFDRDNYSPASQFFSFHFVCKILKRTLLLQYCQTICLWFAEERQWRYLDMRCKSGSGQMEMALTHDPNLKTESQLLLSFMCRCAPFLGKL